MASIQLTTSMANEVKNVLMQHPELRQGIKIQGAIMEVENKVLPDLANFLRALPKGAGKSGLGKVADVVESAMSREITRGTLAADQVFSIPPGGVEALQRASVAMGAPSSPLSAAPISPTVNSMVNPALNAVTTAATDLGVATPAESIAAQTARFGPQAAQAATQAASAAPIASIAPAITPAAEIGADALKTFSSREFQSALNPGGKVKSLLSWGPKRALTAGEQAAKSALMSGATAEEALAAASATKSLPSWLAPGSAGRGLGYGIGGQVASSLLRTALGGERDGTLDNAAESALAWGGAGAGIGSTIAPGIGTVIGGLGGALVGGIKGYLTGEDSDAKQIRDYMSSLNNPKSVTDLYDQMLRMGMSSPTANKILAQLGTLTSQAKTKTEAQQIIAQVLPNLSTIAAQEQAQRSQLAQNAANSQYVNSTFMPTYNESITAMKNDARQYAMAQQAAASTFTNPALGKLYAAGAMALPYAADRQAATMQAQLAALQMMNPAPATSFYPNVLGGGVPMTAAPNQPQQVPNMGILAGVGA